jgi:hypothetical protein
MKKILSLFVFLTLLASSVFGSSTYTSDSSGFYVYEDWDSFNESMWWANHAGWEITDWGSGISALSFLENDSSVPNQIAGWVLNNPSFQIPLTSNFTIRERMRFYDDNDIYGWHGYEVQNRSDAVGTLATAETYYSHLYPPYSGEIWYYEYNGTGVSLYDDTVASGITSTSWGTYMFVKNYLENGTVEFKYYFDDVLQWTHYSTYNFLNEMPNNTAWFAIAGYDPDGTQDHQWSMDFLEINVTHAQEAPACVPDWSCIGYADCVGGFQDCNAVTDLNTCGESYSGNYSEFTPQACSESPFTYSSDDLAPATINTIAKGFIAFSRLAIAFFMVGFIIWGVGKLGLEKILGKK